MEPDVTVPIDDSFDDSFDGSGIHRRALSSKLRLSQARLSAPSSRNGTPTAKTRSLVAPNETKGQPCEIWPPSTDCNDNQDLPSNRGTHLPQVQSMPPNTDTERLPSMTLITSPVKSGESRLVSSCPLPVLWSSQPRKHPHLSRSLTFLPTSRHNFKALYEAGQVQPIPGPDNGSPTLQQKLDRLPLWTNLRHTTPQVRISLPSLTSKQFLDK